MAQHALHLEDVESELRVPEPEHDELDFVAALGHPTPAPVGANRVSNAPKSSTGIRSPSWWATPIALGPFHSAGNGRTSPWAARSTSSTSNATDRPPAPATTRVGGATAGPAWPLSRPSRCTRGRSRPRTADP